MKPRKYIKWIVVILCICVTSVLILVVQNCFKKEVSNSVQTSKDGITIPKKKVSLEEGTSAAGMVEFFVYKGRSYAKYDTIKKDVRDSCLGRVKNTIDEWTEKDEYVDFSGNIEGDIYSVKGYDSEFMLCMKQESGIVIYINDNDFKLKKGADLFEKRLKISEDCSEVTYETQDSWAWDKKQFHILDKKENDIVNSFAAALNDGKFMWVEEIPREDENDNPYEELQIYHVYLQMESGINIHLRLFKGGYVSFDGVTEVCVPIKAEIFNQLIQCFAKQMKIQSMDIFYYPIVWR